MTRSNIEKIKEIVKKRCPKDQVNWEYDGHILLVAKYSKLLAKKLKANGEIVEIAALLHDITKWRNSKNHHITGAKEAEKILKKLEYSRDKIEKIKHCIYSHRGSQNIKRETKEAVCVASADAMAHFESIPSLYYIAFIIKGKDFFEGEKWVRNKLKRDWDRLIPEAKEIIKNKYNASKEII